jgi:hypothetical protein
MTLTDIAHRLGGEVVGWNTARVPGPARGPGDRTLQITVCGDDLRIYSFAGDDFRVCAAHVRARLAAPDRKLRDGRH